MNLIDKYESIINAYVEEFDYYIDLYDDDISMYPTLLARAHGSQKCLKDILNFIKEYKKKKYKQTTLLKAKTILNKSNAIVNKKKQYLFALQRQSVDLDYTVQLFYDGYINIFEVIFEKLRKLYAEAYGIYYYIPLKDYEKEKQYFFTKEGVDVSE